MNSLASALVLLLVAAVAVDAVGRTQSASVRGRLTCKGRPAGGLTIKLYDHDTFTPDDQMARGVTNGDGSFNIAGHKSELLAVRPDLKIYHRFMQLCVHSDSSSGHIFTKCHKIRVPADFVSSGKSPSKTYDVGTIALEAVKNNC
ncbi:Ttr-18 [Aphelenchoides fujianensis]|nr:Ttr-18 [Aphelenchoides fujianensis]